MERYSDQVAIVTGASSGIGEAIAKKLVEFGLQVAGLARRVEKVEELSKELENQPGKLHPVKCDLTDEESILQAFHWTRTNLGPVNILVNNAGYVSTSYLSKAPTEEVKKILDTNVFGLCVATKEALRIMNENKIQGHIVHISSISSSKAVKSMNGVYAASKYAVRALTESLRQEFSESGSKCRITSICPGVVETDMTTYLIKKCPDIPTLKSSDVADAVIFALSTPPHVNVSEIEIRPVGDMF